MESLKSALTSIRNQSSKTTRRIIGLVMLVGIAATGSVSGAQSVTLAWDPSPDLTVVGYTVRYGTNTGRYSEFLVVGPFTQATVPNLVEGVSYFFSVTSHTLLGIESDPSQ